MSNTTKMPSRKVRYLLYFSIFALMGLAVFQEFRLENQPLIQTTITPSSNGKEFMPVKGEIKVFIDDKLVYQDHNVIQIRFYDVLGCKIWNISTSCIGGIFQNTSSKADLTGIVLSFSSNTPLAVETTCPNRISDPGLTVKNVDTKTQIVDSNSIVLTTSWVNTSGLTVNNIARVCLLARDYVVAPPQGTVSYASALFTPQSLANNAQITIQWTFSF